MVAGGKNNVDAVLTIVSDDRRKKRYVGRIVEIYPDGFCDVFKKGSIPMRLRRSICGKAPLFRRAAIRFLRLRPPRLGKLRSSKPRKHARSSHWSIPHTSAGSAVRPFARVRPENP